MLTYLFIIAYFCLVGGYVIIQLFIPSVVLTGFLLICDCLVVQADVELLTVGRLLNQMTVLSFFPVVFRYFLHVCLSNARIPSERQLPLEDLNQHPETSHGSDHGITAPGPEVKQTLAMEHGCSTTI